MYRKVRKYGKIASAGPKIMSLSYDIPQESRNSAEIIMALVFVLYYKIIVGDQFCFIITRNRQQPEL